MYVLNWKPWTKTFYAAYPKNSFFQSAAREKKKMKTLLINWQTHNKGLTLDKMSEKLELIFKINVEFTNIYF